MYGMIHKGARHAVIKTVGEEIWQKCLSTSQLSEEHFISAVHYSDVATYSLVEAISIECRLTIKQVLHSAGRYWIEYAAQAGYGNIIRLTGRTLPEFIINLDRMHASLKRTLTNAVLPSFELISADTDRLEIIYRSQRDGFEPFVAGIFVGVLEHFGEKMEIKYEITDDGTRFTLLSEKAVMPAINKSGDAMQMAI